jgi:hypothetical protein
LQCASIYCIINARQTLRGTSEAKTLYFVSTGALRPTLSNRDSREIIIATRREESYDSGVFSSAPEDISANEA